MLRFICFIYGLWQNPAAFVDLEVQDSSSTIWVINKISLFLFAAVVFAPHFCRGGGTKHNNNNWCVSLIIPHAERPILASFPLCLWLLVSAFWEKRDYPTSFHILITCIFNSSLVFPWEKLSEHRSLVKSRYRVAEKTTLREGVCVNIDMTSFRHPLKWSCIFVCATDLIQQPLSFLYLQTRSFRCFIKDWM